MEVTKYPDICCTCNEPTTNRVKLHRAGKLAGSGTPHQHSSSAYDWMLVVFGGFLGILALLASKASGRGESGLGSFTCYVPQCKRCAAEKRIEPASADLEHHRVSILVNRRFADAVNELNRR